MNMLFAQIGPCLSLIVTLFVFASLTDGTSGKTKECKLKEMEAALVQKKPTMNQTIHKFTPRSILQAMQNCTVFIGDLKINSFGAKDRHLNEFVRTVDLENVKQLPNIHGDVLLDLSQYSNIKNLSFLNGISIRGRGYPLSTFSLRNSQVAYLFPPKYQIDSYHIEIINNTQLCYIQNLTIAPFDYYTISGNKALKDCQRDGKVCDNECRKCKGPGRNAYLCSCKNFQYNDMCISTCPNNTYVDFLQECNNCSSSSSLKYYYKTKSGLTRCAFCDLNCAIGCSGTSSKDCFSCNIYKYFYDKNNMKKFQCVWKCPKNHGAKQVKDMATGKWTCNNNAAGNGMSSLLTILSVILISKLASNIM